MSTEKNNLENITLESVPLSERKSWQSVALIQSGVLICVPSLMLGSILAESMSMTSAILSGATGFAIVIALMIFIGIIGSDIGVPTCVVAAGCFGKKGSSRLISALFMVSMVGWFAIQSAVCGTAFSNLIAQATGFVIPDAISTAIWGAIMLITAVYGINALDKLNTIAIPALVIVTCIGCYMAISQFGTDSLYLPVEPTMSFVDGVVLTISFMATGALNAPDFTRYQKNRKDTILSSTIGVMPAGMAMIILGAIMTRVANQYDISIIFSEIGLPFLGLVVLILATWTTNTTNAYSAGLDAVMVFGLKENQRAIATIVLGIIGTILAILGVANLFESFLYVLGDAFMPIVSMFIIEYWFFAKGKAEHFILRDGWYMTGLISWVLGFAATRLAFGISFVNGMIVAGVCYIILSKVMPNKK